MKSQNVPYRREEFREKHTIIEFDSDFNMADASIMSNTSAAKDMSMLQASIDSMKWWAIVSEDNITGKFLKGISVAPMD